MEAPWNPGAENQVDDKADCDGEEKEGSGEDYEKPGGEELEITQVSQEGDGSVSRQAS